jgi:hypothetical protein
MISIQFLVRWNKIWRWMNVMNYPKKNIWEIRSSSSSRETKQHSYRQRLKAYASDLPFSYNYKILVRFLFLNDHSWSCFGDNLEAVGGARSGSRRNAFQCLARHLAQQCPWAHTVPFLSSRRLWKWHRSPVAFQHPRRERAESRA